MISKKRNKFIENTTAKLMLIMIIWEVARSCIHLYLILINWNGLTEWDGKNYERHFKVHLYTEIFSKRRKIYPECIDVMPITFRPLGHDFIKELIKSYTCGSFWPFVPPLTNACSVLDAWFFSALSAKFECYLNFRQVWWYIFQIFCIFRDLQSASLLSHGSSF